MFWWFILALVIGAGVIFLVTSAIDNKIKAPWWTWVLLGLGVLFLVLAIENFHGSMQEDETQAAWLLALTFGLPSVVCLILSLRFMLAGQQK